MFVARKIVAVFLDLGKHVFADTVGIVYDDDE